MHIVIKGGTPRLSGHREHELCMKLIYQYLTYQNLRDYILSNERSIDEKSEVKVEHLWTLDQKDVPQIFER